MIKFFCFTFNIPYPKISIGDIFVHEDAEDILSESLQYKVIDIKNKRANMRHIWKGNESLSSSIKLKDLRAFYIKIF